MDCLSNDERLAVEHLKDGMLKPVTANLDGPFQRDANDGPAGVAPRWVVPLPIIAFGKFTVLLECAAI